jgi:hypothetical protein
MTTETQVEANPTNPAGSTGPDTQKDRSLSSRNAFSPARTSADSPMLPDENDEFNQFTEGMRRDLAPEGALEVIFVAEITRAAWRLRRCASVEDVLQAASSEQHAEPLLDSTANPAAIGAQAIVDRARAEAHRILKRSMDELRRLQNERRFRVEVLPVGFNLDDLGLASYKDLMSAMVTEKRWQHLKRQLEVPASDASFERMLAATVGPRPAPKKAPPTKQTHSEPKIDSTKETDSAETGSTKRSHLLPHTARNAACPCGSGQKHKRCCGQNAAPLLYPAAA